MTSSLTQNIGLTWAEVWELEFSTGLGILNFWNFQIFHLVADIAANFLLQFEGATSNIIIFRPRPLDLTLNGQSFQNNKINSNK